MNKQILMDQLRNKRKALAEELEQHGQIQSNIYNIDGTKNIKKIKYKGYIYTVRTTNNIITGITTKRFK